MIIKGVSHTYILGSVEIGIHSDLKSQLNICLYIHSTNPQHSQINQSVLDKMIHREQTFIRLCQNLEFNVLLKYFQEKKRENTGKVLKPYSVFGFK